MIDELNKAIVEIRNKFNIEQIDITNLNNYNLKHIAIDLTKLTLDQLRQFRYHVSLLKAIDDRIQKALYI